MSSSYVDLTSGYYDNFEYALSQKLGLKLLLVRDWDCPTACAYSRLPDGSEIYPADADPDQLALARDIHEWQNDPEFQAEMNHPLTEAQTDSLAQYITERDTLVGQQMSGDECLSVIQCLHATVRLSACEAPGAVVLHDIIVQEADLAKALMGEFHDSWSFMGDDVAAVRPIAYAALADGFSLKTDEYRAYNALLRARYALRHENEYHALGTRAGGALYHKFMPAVKEQPGLGRNIYGMPYDEARDFIDMSADDMTVPLAGVDGGTLQKKMMNIYAIQNLMTGGSAAPLLFAAMHQRYGEKHVTAMTDEKAKSYGRALRELLVEELKQRADADDMRIPLFMQDPRVIIPLFREVKDLLRFDPAGQIYADVTWEAARQMFPTLSCQPVPSLVTDKAPPDSSEAYALKDYIARSKEQYRATHNPIPRPGG